MSSLRRGETLLAGGQLTSENGHFAFIVHNDGSLVVYDPNGVKYWTADTSTIYPPKTGKNLIPILVSLPRTTRITDGKLQYHDKK